MLALGATVSGLLVLALGATGLAVLPVVLTLGAAVTAFGAIPAPPEAVPETVRALGGTRVVGATPTALGAILTFGGVVVAVGPTLPIPRPRCAKPALVSKPSRTPQISIRFIRCPPYSRFYRGQ